jgi:hypothetical protein
MPMSTMTATTPTDTTTTTKLTNLKACNEVSYSNGFNPSSTKSNISTGSPLRQLFSENITAKILLVAEKYLQGNVP